MRFFHLSDLHIGLKLMNRDLREDQEYILAEVVEAAAQEKPDAIVVGVPEGIIPLTKKHHFNYGVYAFEICCAVAPDYVILALPYGEYNDEFYEEMKILCQYRLNTRLDSFYVSSYQPISNSFTKPSLEFTQSNGVITHDAKYTVFRDTDDRLLAEHIIKKLTMYDEYQIM